jgi:hypothetical protein
MALPSQRLNSADSYLEERGLNPAFCNKGEEDVVGKVSAALFGGLIVCSRIYRYEARGSPAAAAMVLT